MLVVVREDVYRNFWRVTSEKKGFSDFLKRRQPGTKVLEKEGGP